MTSLDQTMSDAASIEPPSGAADLVRGDGSGPAEVEQETAANLLAGLATRLRSAYEAGADLADLAAACHQPLPTVRRLLAEAGVELNRQPSAAGSGPGPDEARQLRRLRRPTPSRRLRRIHAAGQSDAAPDSAVDSPSEPPSGSVSGPASPSTSSSPSASASASASDASESRSEGRAASFERSVPGAAEPERTPMGILIGASPRYVEPAPQVGSERERRVTAQLIRTSRGTSLVVLPDWRTAIAVSVPTEQLLASTGLDFSELGGVRLSVVINPEALHDRELDLREWRVEPHAGGPRVRP